MANLFKRVSRARQIASVGPICFMAGIKINVRSNANSLVTELLAEGGEMKQATARALNRMAEQVRTQASRNVRAAGYNLKAADIKKAMRLNRATPANLCASVVTSGRPIALYKYGAKQTGKGVSVSVQKGRKVIAHAFIATMPSGHTGVYMRAPGAKHKKKLSNGKASWHALPIRELFGPAIPDAVANEKVQAAILRLVAEKFPQILAREYAWKRRQLSN